MKGTPSPVARGLGIASAASGAIVWMRPDPLPPAPFVEDMSSKKQYIRQMVRVLGALMVVTFTGMARGEEPAAASSAAPTTAAGPPAVSVDTAKASCGAQVTDFDAEGDAEERAFLAELESFARRRAFTERLIAKREAEAFERASQLHARAANLKRELTEREAAMVQREFDEAVALYLKKRALTLALSVAASRARPTPSDSPPAQ